MSATEGTTTTVTEKLTLTKDARETLVSLFVESKAIKVRRVKGLLRYHTWTTDQVIAAMHESADREGVTLVIATKERSTMARTMAVVKAWVATKAHELVTEDDDTRDAVFEYLSAIADITPAALEKYLVDEAEREDPKVKEYEEILVEPLPGAKVQFTPFAVEVPHGTGEKAMPGIVAEYLTHRLKDEPGDIAHDWLRRYMKAVQFANNEKRRAAQAHDTIAADSRVGSGARNPGGSSGKDEESTVEKTEGTPSHKLPGDKPVRELTTGELIVALTKRVVDYSQPLTAADAKAWDEMTGHYEQRFDHVPLGKTAMTPAGQAIYNAPDAPAPTPWPAGLEVAPPTGPGEVGLTPVVAPITLVDVLLAMLTPEQVAGLISEHVAA